MSVKDKRYKYDIFINQFACVENGFNLDIIDLAIFCYIKDFSTTNECLKIHTPEGIYFWISHSKLLDEMPLLNIKTKQGLIKRINKLIENKIFEKHKRCEYYAKTLYKTGLNYDKLMFTDFRNIKGEQEFTPLNKSLETPLTKVDGTLNKSLETPLTKVDGTLNKSLDNNNHYNIIYINNNNLNNIDTNVSFPEKFIELYNLYSGSKKDLETEYNNWIEKCEWNVDYDFLISKLKKTDKQHFQSWLNKFRTEPSKFRKIIIEEYLKFHEEKTSFKLSLKAYQINSCENISKYIESAVKLKSNSLGKVIDNIEQDVRDSIVFIFSNWNLLNDFYRSQISIEQIDKNFSNIVQQIKQGYAKQQQSESDPKIGRTRLSSLEKLRQQMLNQ